MLQPVRMKTRLSLVEQARTARMVLGKYVFSLPRENTSQECRAGHGPIPSSLRLGQGFGCSKHGPGEPSPSARAQGAAQTRSAPSRESPLLKSHWSVNTGPRLAGPRLCQETLMKRGSEWNRKQGSSKVHAALRTHARRRTRMPRPGFGT